MPVLDTQLLTKLFNITNGICHGVVTDIANGRGSSTAALVEDHNAEKLRIKKTPVRFGAAGARAAMQEQNGFSVRVATLLPVELVRFINRHDAAFIRLDRGIEIFISHGPIVTITAFATAARMEVPTSLLVSSRILTAYMIWIRALQL